MGLANMLRKRYNSPRLPHFHNKAKFQQAAGTGGKSVDSQCLTSIITCTCGWQWWR